MGRRGESHPKCSSGRWGSAGRAGSRSCAGKHRSLDPSRRSQAEASRDVPGRSNRRDRVAARVRASEDRVHYLEISPLVVWREFRMSLGLALDLHHLTHGLVAEPLLRIGGIYGRLCSWHVRRSPRNRGAGPASESSRPIRDRWIHLARSDTNPRVTPVPGRRRHRATTPSALSAPSMRCSTTRRSSVSACRCIEQ